MRSRQQSNYDRWKSSTKLACMIELKKISSSEDYYDPNGQRFAPMTWHLVADALNREYPHCAKRFTNINIKGRYDRIVKYHRVFKRLAANGSGFRWNARLFSFEDADITRIQLERGELDDPLLAGEVNKVRLLKRAGHIDLEYYHRYIYVPEDQQEIDNDTVLNTPSFIATAIDSGVLTLASDRPDFFHNLSSSSSTSSTSSTSSSSSSSSSSVSSLSSASSSTTTHDGSVSAFGSISSHSTLDLSQHHHPSMAQLVPQSGYKEYLTLHPPQPIQPPATIPQSLQDSVQPLHQQAMISPVSEHLEQYPSIYQAMGPPPSTLMDPANERKRRRVQHIAPGVSMAGSMTPAGHMGPLGTMNHFMYDLSPDDGQQHPLSNQAMVQIHREFEAMKSNVNEKVLFLRLNRMISYQVFDALQELMERCVPFLRSAHNRLNDDGKLLELIAAYVEKD